MPRQRDQLFEFGALVASVNVTAATIAAGVLVRSEASAGDRCLLIAFLSASSLAVLIAYFGIQVGASTTSGPLALWPTALSFLVAACQVAMFATVGAAAESSSVGRHLLDTDYVTWWIALAAAFALLGGVSSFTVSKRRVWPSGWKTGPRWEAVRADIKAYEAAQFRERRGAIIAFLAELLCGVASIYRPTFLVAWIAVMIYIGGISFGLNDQRIAARHLWKVQHLL